MMNIKFPLIELIDRLAIADVKFKRTNGANEEELNWYMNQATSFDLDSILTIHFHIASVSCEGLRSA